MKKTKKVTKVQISKHKFDKKNSSLSEAQSKNIKSDPEAIKDLQVQFDDFQELFEDVSILGCINPLTKGLNLKKLINLLEKDYNVFVKDKFIKFYLQQGGVYISVPSTKKALSNLQIDQEDYISNKTLKFQLFKNKQLIDVVMQDSQEQSDQNNDEQDQNDQKILEGTFYQNIQENVEDQKRERLSMSQKRYLNGESFMQVQNLFILGIQNGEEKSERVSLEQGARIVNISKKTLDDYLSQLKKGKKYGFNFNDHKNQKIGVLREYIRKMQKKR